MVLKRIGIRNGIKTVDVHGKVRVSQEPVL